MEAVFRVFGSYGHHISAIFLVIFLASFSLEEGRLARVLQVIAGGIFTAAFLFGLACCLLI
ncbi:MAG: hypothetical protein ACLRWF_01870 [Ruthenibacterium sp.]